MTSMFFFWMVIVFFEGSLVCHGFNLLPAKTISVQWKDCEPHLSRSSIKRTAFKRNMLRMERHYENLDSNNNDTSGRESLLDFDVNKNDDHQNNTNEKSLEPEIHNSTSPYNRALHQVKHRTKDKVYSKMAGHVTEKIGELAEKSTHKGTKRLMQEGFERVWEMIAIIFQRAKRQQERLLELASQSAERSSARLVERISERIVDKGGEQIVSKTGTKTIMSRSGKSVAEHFVESTGERMLERRGERSVIRVAKRVRIAKGLAIALPVIGGVFAIYLFRQDMERLDEERVYLSSVAIGESRVKPYIALFVGAALADLIDVILHFFISIGLLRHFQHHKLAAAEELIMGCAVISTVCAVVAEIASFHMRRKKNNRDKIIVDNR